MSDDNVLVDLDWTYGVTRDRRTTYYGPGRVEVPRDLAEARGWQVVETIQLTDLSGVNDELAAAMTAVGFDSVEAVAKADVKDLTAVSGIAEKKAKALIKQAQELMDAPAE